jgi:hypothetical protein
MEARVGAAGREELGALVVFAVCAQAVMVMGTASIPEDKSSRVAEAMPEDKYNFSPESLTIPGEEAAT